MKKLLLLLFLLSITISQSQTFNDGVLEYTVTDAINNYVSVIKYSNICPIGTLVIPENIMEGGTAYTITSIEQHAFRDCDDLTDVVIPDSVTTIGIGAFYSCNGLANINIPEGVTIINEATFYYCTSLTSVTLPETVNRIYDNAFYNCTGLTSINIPEDIIKIYTYAFYNCNSLTSISFPEGISEIGSYAFKYSGLINVTIPGSLTSIGREVFSGCTGLTNVTISEGVTDIEYFAFDNCSNLTSVNIPESVTSFEDYVFNGCTGLTNVTVNWATPLVINTTVFNNVAIENIPLTVPSGTEALYESAAVWQDFASFNLGVSEVNQTISLKLYPNPVQDELYITLAQGIKLNTVNIYNTLGQFITSANNFKVKTNNLTNGIYFIEVKTDKGSSVKRIVIE